MKSILTKVLFIISWIFIASKLLHDVLSGSIPFWYDPARDMLMGWDNLHKFTLIGPTSGIPGIFYGPHWIWMLSFGEIFSKDPRIVILLVETIPYLLLFPLGLYLFVRAKIFDELTGVLLWIVFAYAFGSYINSIWSPNPAPLVLLYAIYFLVVNDYKKITRRSLIYALCGGLLSGFAFQLQISFSSGFITGSIFFIVIASIVGSKKYISIPTIKNIFFLIASFFTGIFVMFSPILIFEVRHGFFQIRTALDAFVKGGGVVLIHGLTKQEILWGYFGRMGTLLDIPVYASVLIMGVLLIIIGIGYATKKVIINRNEKMLLLLVLCITLGVLGIYLSAKNPVWAYHFVGSEIIAMLLLGFIVFKTKVLRFVLLAWICYLSVIQAQGFVASFKINPLFQSSLRTKEYEVKIITGDAKGKDYAVFVYSPSIYTYEYNYLFRWIAHKEFSYDPGQITRKKVTYLILPQGEKAKLEDFVHYRTPDKEYITTKVWRIPDRTVILKRESQ